MSKLLNDVKSVPKTVIASWDMIAIEGQVWKIKRVLSICTSQWRP